MLPQTGLTPAIIELQTLKKRIESSTVPFLTEKELKNYVTPILLKLLNWKPQLSTQFKNFWYAQLDIHDAAVANLQNPQYDPLELANKAKIKIAGANDIYLSVVDKFNQNPSEKTYLYAIFYAHILRTETAEYSFRKHLEDLLVRYGLDAKYDANEIFSVEKKVAKGKEYRTDARAIRDALGHYQYTIDDVYGSWEIKFHNTDEGYNYNRIFGKTEFLRFMEDTDALYKTQLHLIWMYVGNLMASIAFQV